jgi:hypothetical protein
MRFLLSHAESAEQAEIEARLFRDDDFLDELHAAGDDLIYAYLAERLSEEDRRAFETHFLAVPEQRERFEFVRTLVTATRTAKHRRLPRIPSLGAMAAALFIAFAWAGMHFGARGPAVEKVPPRLTPTAASIPAPLAQVAANVFRLQETGAVPVAIEVRHDTPTVRLEVPIVNDRHPSYDVALRNAAGVAIWEMTDLVASGPGHSLILDMPARLMDAGEYVLQVEGEYVRGARPRPRLSVTYRLRVTSSDPPQRQLP